MVELGIVEAVGVDAKDLSDVNVGARVVNLRVVGPKRGIVNPVHFLDPSASAVTLAIVSLNLPHGQKGLAYSFSTTV